MRGNVGANPTFGSQGRATGGGVASNSPLPAPLALFSHPTPELVYLLASSLPHLPPYCLRATRTSATENDVLFLNLETNGEHSDQSEHVQVTSCVQVSSPFPLPRLPTASSAPRSPRVLDVWNRYGMLTSPAVHSASLIRRPMVTQCATAFTLFGAGDILAQQAFEKKGSNHDVSTSTPMSLLTLASEV
uniref:BHLH domain-containing protein n=1 Tax=Ganoderma boninense TaxID=34458 RepID=A0A5K1K4R7_9APHY|nr:BHLH domain-containing protein [Ganoderma boninense]